jgi:uncharacterized membrane protein YfcA
MHTYGLVLLAAFGAGFVNAIGGGGTLLTFPALLYSGLMPALNASIAANATNTCSVWPGSAMSSWAYRRQLAGHRARVWTLMIPSLLGGVAGAVLLLQTPEKVFRFVVPYLILLACGLLLANEPIGRWMAARAAAHPRKHAAALWLSQFLIAVYGGYFGAGIGILMLAAMAIFLPEDLQAANGMKNLFATLINAIAAVYFVVVGAAVLKIALAMALASVVGGFVGARTAQRMSVRLLRGVVVAFGVVVAVQLMVKP